MSSCQHDVIECRVGKRLLEVHYYLQHIILYHAHTYTHTHYGYLEYPCKIDINDFKFTDKRKCSKTFKK